MAKSPSPAFPNSPFLQLLKLKFTKSSPNLSQISSLQETQNPPTVFEGLDVLIPNDTSIDNFLPSPDSHDGEQEGNLLHANMPNVKGSVKSNAVEDFYKHNKEFEVRDLL